jgi:hypothetical protein
MDINELMITTGSVRCDRLFFLELLTESLRDKMTQIPLKYSRKKKKKPGFSVGAHTCNPGYSGSRDQEDCVSKPAWTNSS